MSKTLRQTIVFVLAMFLLAPVAVPAQQEKISNSQNSTLKAPKATKIPTKLPLQSLTLVSTSEAVRRVAEEANANAETAKKGAATSNHSEPKQEANGAVLEFRAIDNSPLIDSAASLSQARDHKKSFFKNIHGSAYGVMVPGTSKTNDESGAIGADSGNGKFNIYVQGEHTHASTPAAH